MGSCCLKFWKIKLMAQTNLKINLINDIPDLSKGIPENELKNSKIILIVDLENHPNKTDKIELKDFKLIHVFFL